jgi:dCTP deaminase
MSWLTGEQIVVEMKHRRITIEPFRPEQVNPNSYDYRLGRRLKKIVTNSSFGGRNFLDPMKPMRYGEIELSDGGFLLQPGGAYLGHTIEVFGSDHFASLVTGKSSIGRLFIHNHICAGLIDQGFLGQITLEIEVQLPTLVYPGMRFGQIFWFESVGPVKLYSGRYQQQKLATPSQIYEDFR